MELVSTVMLMILSYKFYHGSLQFTETTGLQSAKGGFAVIILSICWI